MSGRAGFANRIGGRAFLALFGTALPIVAMAASPATGVALRGGDHPGFGRIVLDLPPGGSVSVTEAPGRLMLQLGDATAIAGMDRLPRNVAAVSGGAGHAEITLAPGVEARRTRLGNRLVIDAVDPADRPATPAQPAPGEHVPAGHPDRPASIAQGRAARSTRTARATMGGSGPTPPIDRADRLAPPGAPMGAVPISPVGRSAPITGGPIAAGSVARSPGGSPPGPVASSSPSPSSPQEGRSPASVTALAAVGDATAVRPAAPAAGGDGRGPAAAAAPAGAGATVIGPISVAARALPATGAGPSVLLPFAAETGAAAFRRGGHAMVVFDEARPVDLAAVAAIPAFVGATIQVTQDATIFTVPLATGSALSLSHEHDGWAIGLETATPSPRGIGIAVAPDGDLHLPAQGPGRAVALADPETGGLLLVGTQHQSGEAVAVARRMPDLALAPTWQGVVVAPLSDHVQLRTDKDGFVVGFEGRALVLTRDAAAPADVAAASLSRRFDFPDRLVPDLLARLQTAIDAAAAAPPLDRGLPRRLAARTMIALGMGAEAEALLQTSEEEDPRLADDPDTVGLKAIAAILADRLEEADGLDDPRLDGSDDVALWRAARTALRQPESAAAAQIFANAAPQIAAYPAALQAFLLPLAGETMARAGEEKAARSLLDHNPDDARLAYARALLAQRAGQTGPALAAFDVLAQGRDQRTAAFAARDAAELRHATHQLSAKDTAAALERQLMAWRDDTYEQGLRDRIVSVRAEAGDFRGAFAMIRESASLWPDRADAARARTADVLNAMLADGSRVAPLDLVALTDENAALLPAGLDHDRLSLLLADHLAALDLPDRAAPVLAKLVANASGPGRAALATRLAAMQLADTDPAAALATLAGSDAPDLPSDLRRERALLAARAMAAKGDVAGAIALLDATGGDAADDQRATLLVQQKDWRGAEAALAALVQRSVPSDGALDSRQQSLLVRLASAASQAGDQPALTRLREQAVTRMTDPRLGDMFRLLTAPPVTTVADLPRAASEVTLARAIPGSIKAVGP